MIICRDVFFLRDAHNCGNQNVDVAIMTHHQCVNVYGGSEIVSKKKSRIMLILFQIVVKLFLIMKMMFFMFKIKWYHLEKLNL